MDFACINIYLKNGQTYGCAAVVSSIKLNPATKQYEPAIAFTCSRVPQVELLSDIDRVTFSKESLFPTCK
jgi:hypothetical protein